MIGELAALAGGLVNALAPVVFKKGLKHAQPFTANFITAVTSTAMLLPILLVPGEFARLFLFDGFTIAMLALGIYFGYGLGNLTYLVTLRHLGVAKSVGIVSSYPFFSILIDAVFLHGRLSLTLLLWASMTFLGIWLLSSGDDSGGYHLTGVAYAMLTSFAWGLSFNLYELAFRSIRASDLFVAAVLRMILMTIGLLVAAVMFRKIGELRSCSRRGWEIFTLGGFFGLVLWGFCLFIGIIFIGASRTSTITSVSPLFSTAMAVLFLREKMNNRILSGIVLAVAGVFGLSAVG